MSAEILLLVGGANFVADSGPGSQVLIKGTTDAGYFGTVTATELFNSSDMYKQMPDALPFITGYKINTDPLWHKFIYHGKILFIATIPLSGNVTWNNLYNGGLVYGTNDNGNYPTATPTKQRRILRKTARGKQYGLIPRTLKLAASDPGAVNNAAPVMGEYSDLLAHIISTAGTTGRGDWNTISGAALAWGSTCWSQTSNSGGTTSALVFSAGGNASTTSKISSGLWLPVLELIDLATVLFSPTITGWSPPDLKAATATPTPDYSSAIKSVVGSQVHQRPTSLLPAIGVATGIINPILATRQVTYGGALATPYAIPSIGA